MAINSQLWPISDHTNEYSDLDPQLYTVNHRDPTGSGSDNPVIVISFRKLFALPSSMSWGPWTTWARLSVAYTRMRSSISYPIEEEESDRREDKGRRCCLGDGIHSIPYRTTDLPSEDLKKRMNRRTDDWQNGCFRKMDDHLVHTSPNYHPPKMDVLSKTLLQIVANWLERHSIPSPKQQRRPLPSLLSVFFCSMSYPLH